MDYSLREGAWKYPGKNPQAVNLIQWKWIDQHLFRFKSTSAPCNICRYLIFTVNSEKTPPREDSPGFISSKSKNQYCIFSHLFLRIATLPDSPTSSPYVPEEESPSPFFHPYQSRFVSDQIRIHQPIYSALLSFTPGVHSRLTPPVEILCPGRNPQASLIWHLRYWRSSRKMVSTLVFIPS